MIKFFYRNCLMLLTFYGSNYTTLLSDQSWVFGIICIWWDDLSNFLCLFCSWILVWNQLSDIMSVIQAIEDRVSTSDKAFKLVWHQCAVSSSMSSLNLVVTPVQASPTPMSPPTLYPLLPLWFAIAVLAILVSCQLL